MFPVWWERMPRGVMLGLILFALVASVFGMLRASAESAGTLDVTVRGSAGGGPDDVFIGTMAYADARDALQDAIDAGDPVTLPIGPAAFVPVTVNGAEVYFDDVKLAIAIQGDANILGLAATMLVTATWVDGDDELPDTAILFSLGGVSLSELTSFDDFPLVLTHSWIAVSSGTPTVDPSDLPDEVASFFDDGLDGTDDAFAVDGALNFRGVIDATGTVLGDAATQIGLSGHVRIDGVLTTEIEGLDGSGPLSATAGFTVTASFPVDTSGGTLPDWFQPSAPWELALSADTGGNISASLSGAADIQVGEETFAVTASVGIAYSEGPPADVTFSLEATIEPPENLFDQDWLDITEFSLNASFSTADGFSGGLEATADLQDLTGQAGATADIAFAFAAGSDGVEGSLTLTTNVSVSLAQVATALGATAPDGLNVTVNGFNVFVGFESGGGMGTALTVAISTNVVVTINSAVIDSDLLLRLTTGGGATTKFLFAVKPDEDAPDVTVGQLLGTTDLGDADITLPRFTLSVANDDWSIPAADLDAATAAYLGDGEDLDAPAGVSLKAEVAIPDALKDALEEAGITVTSELVLEGRLPVLGGTELSIAIEFPMINVAPFEDATLKLFFKKDNAVPPKFEIGLSGEATVVVPKTEKAGCTETSTTPECVDRLIFDLSATLILGGGGIGFDLEGGLTAGDDAGWVEPFGLQGLTIYELRMKLGVRTVPPSVRLGMLGRLSINGTDVTVSFLLGITANPPFVDPIGFTFATNGFSLLDIATLHSAVSGEPAVSTAALPPDLRLEDVFVAFGRESDESLCIRQGFFLTAELHLGGTLEVSGDPPPCEPPPTSPPAATAECQNTSSCLASILLDINTGAGGGVPSLNAAGFFRGAELGPLTFDPLIIELTLSASTQRLFISGGASFDDPFDTGPNPSEWASGSFVLDFSTTRLFLSAELNLADGAALHVKVTGEAILSLTDPVFTLELEFRSDLLDSVVDEIETGFNQLAADVDNFFARLQEADNNNPNVWRNLLVLMQEEGTAPQWLVDFVSTMAEVEDTVASVNQAFTDIGLPPPFLTLAIRDWVLHGIDLPGLPGIPGATIGTFCLIPDIIFGGCAVTVVIDPPECLGTKIGNDCWFIPPTAGSHLPGLCDDPTFAGDLHDVLCTDLSEKALIGELFEDKLDDLGLDVPPGQTPEDVLTKLHEVFTGTGVQGTCGFAKVDYGAHTISPSELTLIIHGKPVVIVTQLDLVNGTFDPDNQVLQKGFDALLAETQTPGEKCNTTSVAGAPTTTSITLEATPETVNEGGAVTASGTTTLTGSVTIAWGDGEVSVATIGSGGAYSATHTYTDDFGPGTSTTYTIRATAGSVSATDRVTVNNVVPTITSAAFVDDDINEGGTASLKVDFTDPGADRHTVQAVWSDGITQSVVLNGPRTHTFTRTLQDDNPSATSVDTLTVDVRVLDKDGGEDSQDDVTLTVRNLNPTGVGIEAIDIIAGGPEVLDSNGDLVVNEGDLVLYRVTFSDAGRDSHNVTIDWGDGSPADSRLVPAPVAGVGTRSFTIAHLFVDDDPTGTPSDAYMVSIDVTDDDTGMATADLPVTVNNVAPTIELFSISTAAHDENEVALTLDLEFTDPGWLDTYVVTIDWGAGWTDATSTAAVVREPDGTYVVAIDDEDARYTTLDITALAGDPGASKVVVRATNRYGDNGVYTIGVSITDDDGGVDEDSAVLTVGNVDPTHAIDDSAADGAVTSGGGQTFIVRQDEDLTLTDTASDPGSDDLFFSWALGDGATRMNEWLRGVPTAGATDPPLSPQVAPRLNVIDTVTHRYAEACLYAVAVQVTDDDGGDGGVDHLGVVVQSDKPADSKRQRNHGQWRAAIQRGEISAAELACYLDIAGYLSTVFLGQSELSGAPFAAPNGSVDITQLDSRGMPTVLTTPPGGGPDKLLIEQRKLDRALLSVWLNFADGVFEWDTVVEGSKTFGQVLAEVEEVRRTATDPRAVTTAWQRLWRLGGGD